MLREMGCYQYHRHTMGGRAEFTISSDLPILHRHSRGYKRPFQKSRFSKNSSHIPLNYSEKGFFVDVDNAIEGKGIRELNYLLHAGITVVLEGLAMSWNEQWCVYVYLLEREKNGSGIFAVMAFLHPVPLEFSSYFLLLIINQIIKMNKHWKYTLTLTAHQQPPTKKCIATYTKHTWTYTSFHTRARFYRRVSRFFWTRIATFLPVE